MEKTLNNVNKDVINVQRNKAHYECGDRKKQIKSFSIDPMNIARINLAVKKGEFVNGSHCVDSILDYFFSNESLNKIMAIKLEAEKVVAIKEAEIKSIKERINLKAELVKSL